MDEEIKKLLKKNLEVAEETRKMVRSIKTSLLLSRIWGVIKILLIVVPVALGIIYLPSLIQKLWDDTRQSLGLTALEQTVDELPSGWQEILKKSGE